MIPTILSTIHTIELIGSHIARHLETGTTEDRTSQRNRSTTKSAIPVLCRKLLALGADPTDRVHIVTKALDRDRTIAVFKRDRTVKCWADIDVVERDTGGIAEVKYKPYPVKLKTTER